MANTPNPPGGALPPRPAEAAKVQPKKETVRINLPPKPTSAPTIKLPTLAPGGPPPAASHAAPVAAAVPVVAVPVAVPSAPKAPTPPASGAPATRVAGAAPAAVAAPRPAATAAPAPRPLPMAVGISGMDQGLAIAAGVLAILCAGASVYLAFFLYTPPS